MLWYQAFTQDIADAKAYQVLTMPVLAMGGIYYAATPGSDAWPPAFPTPAGNGGSRGTSQSFGIMI